MAVEIHVCGGQELDDMKGSMVSSIMKNSHHALLGLILSGGLAASLVGCARQPVAIPQGEGNVKNSATGLAQAASKDGKTAAKDKSSPGKPGEGRYFADDPGGQMLAELLRPIDLPPLKPTEPISPQRQFTPPRSLERPELPVPSSQASLPRPPLDLQATPVRPRSLPESAPFSTYRIDPQLPQQENLPAGGRVRLPSPDVNEPTPLPILAQPVIDRASLEDPTVSASTQAALAAVPPVRSEPAPFVRLPLPDPFELQHTVRLRLPLPEDPSPYASVSRP